MFFWLNLLIFVLVFFVVVFFIIFFVDGGWVIIYIMFLLMEFVLWVDSILVDICFVFFLFVFNFILLIRYGVELFFGMIMMGKLIMIVCWLLFILNWMWLFVELLLLCWYEISFCWRFFKVIVIVDFLFFNSCLYLRLLSIYRFIELVLLGFNMFNLLMVICLDWFLSRIRFLLIVIFGVFVVDGCMVMCRIIGKLDVKWLLNIVNFVLKIWCFDWLVFGGW